MSMDRTSRTVPSMDMNFVMSRTCPEHFIYNIPIYIYIINNCKIASILASSDSILMIYVHWIRLDELNLMIGVSYL